MANSLADAVSALQRGQELEARGTQADMEQALRAYDEAISRFETLARAGQAEAVPHLGIAWMNRGNALLRFQDESAVKEALVSYERAIQCLDRSPSSDVAARNSLAAAWMNRGLSLHRLRAPEALAESEKSQRQAIALFRGLPTGENPWILRNLAAAHLNLANLLLDLKRFAEARMIACAALPDLLPTEKNDLVSADLTLKARRAWCDALGQLLANPAPELSRDDLAAEASDAVDDAFALIRHWQAQDPRLSSDLAVRFFRFGTQLYRFHQPHFLAEFVLENLDTSPPSQVPEFRAIAQETIAAALRDLRLPPFFSTENPAHARLAETSRSLQEALQQLAALPPPPAAPGAEA